MPGKRAGTAAVLACTMGVMPDLHVEDYGTGEPRVVRHGSGSWGAETFGAQRALVGHSTGDTVALLAAGRFPKLVAVGAWDPAIHPELAEIAASRQRQALQAEHRALAQRINADVVTFSRSTHNPMVEEPDRFNALLRDIWRRAHDE